MSKKILLLAFVGLTLLCVVLAYLLSSGVRCFVDEYYLYPVINDVAGVEEGGYNFVNTPTYGIIVVIVLLLFNRLFRKLNIRIDLRTALMIFPFVVLGSVLRVVEDAGCVSPDVGWLLITPVIYIWIGLIVLTLIMVEHWWMEEKCGFYVTGMVGWFLVMLSFLPLLTLSWVNIVAVPIITLLTLGMLSVVVLVFAVVSKFYKPAICFLSVSNILLYVVHFLDVGATSVGLGSGMYFEKQIISSSISTIGFFLLKIISITMVIYFLDVQKKFDVKLRGLSKLSIFVLGFAPATRDILRIMMGV